MSRLPARPANPAVDGMSNLDLLDAIDQLIDTQGEYLDEDILGSYLATLDERAPIGGGFDPQAGYARFEARQASFSSAPPKRKTRGWFRPFILVAALAAIAAVTVAASIDQIDVFDGFVNWAGETFRMDDPSGDMLLRSPNEDGHQSLNTALAGHGLIGIAPSWVPTRFNITGIEVAETEHFIEYTSSYGADNGDELYISTVILYNGLQSSIEMNPDTDTIVEHNGLQFAIVENNSLLNVYWGTQSYECFIDGHITRDEAINMIESVGN